MPNFFNNFNLPQIFDLDHVLEKLTDRPINLN